MQLASSTAKYCPMSLRTANLRGSQRVLFKDAHISPLRLLVHLYPTFSKSIPTKSPTVLNDILSVLCFSEGRVETQGLAPTGG